jgi:hypothetical protein
MNVHVALVWVVHMWPQLQSAAKEPHIHKLSLLTGVDNGSVNLARDKLALGTKTN